MIMTTTNEGGCCINLLIIKIIIISLMLASPNIATIRCHDDPDSGPGSKKSMALRITEGMKADQPIAPMMMNKRLEQQEQDSRRSVRSLHNVPSGPNPISNATPKGYRRKARSPPQQRH